MKDVARLDDDQLSDLLAVARELVECERILSKTKDNILTLLLNGLPENDMRHYPETDVYDAEHHAQYYFHAHPVGSQPLGEVGHFHTFLRPLGMPEGVAPLAAAEPAPDLDGNSALSHLVGVALDGLGRPVRLFTTNRWVTGETWYPASDVVRMLDGFVIDHARPNWVINRWLTALVRFYHQPIRELLAQRDAALAVFRENNPESFAYDDRMLEVLSELRIDMVDRVRLVEREAQERRRKRRRQPETGLHVANIDG